MVKCIRVLDLSKERVQGSDLAKVNGGVRKGFPTLKFSLRTIRCMLPSLYGTFLPSLSHIHAPTLPLNRDKSKVKVGVVDRECLITQVNTQLEDIFHMTIPVWG